MSQVRTDHQSSRRLKVVLVVALLGMAGLVSIAWVIFLVVELRLWLELLLG